MFWKIKESRQERMDTRREARQKIQAEFLAQLQQQAQGRTGEEISQLLARQYREFLARSSVTSADLNLEQMLHRIQAEQRPPPAVPGSSLSAGEETTLYITNFKVIRALQRFIAERSTAGDHDPERPSNLRTSFPKPESIR